jgi:hypothetical protein
VLFAVVLTESQFNVFDTFELVNADKVRLEATAVTTVMIGELSGLNRGGLDRSVLNNKSSRHNCLLSVGILA